MSVAARPQQANRCSLRAYLIPPGIILILVSHAFDPRYRAPVTLPLLLWARRSKVDCARSCRHLSSLQQTSQAQRARQHRTLALAPNESQPRPRWSLAAEALRWEKTGTSLCYLWS